MSYGNPRQPSAFTVGGMADDALTQQLALYKPVATIRDMKQVYFYAGANAGISWVHPLRFLNPVLEDVPWNWQEIMKVGQSNPKFVANPWYLPIGTERKLDISNLVNDLLDIRVPKDKYVLEINLVECNIESDTANWLTIPDFVFARPVDITGANPIPTELATYPTFTRKPLYGTPENGEQTLVNAPEQATKVSTPQTLFVRIKEVCNNQPYNWTVTNTGQYTLDKSHQLLIRHGDINYSALTLEFGHMVFTGLDIDEAENANKLPAPILFSTGSDINPAALPLYSPTLPQNSRKENIKYLDYNSEVFNAIGTPSILPSGVGAGLYSMASACVDAYYIDEYKTGYYETQHSLKSTDRTNLIQPSNRPPFIVSPQKILGGLSENTPVPPPTPPTPDVPPWTPVAGTILPSVYIDNYGTRLEQGIPLKSNQQVKSIIFRFMVRVIHLF